MSSPSVQKTLSHHCTPADTPYITSGSIDEATNMRIMADAEKVVRAVESCDLIGNHPIPGECADSTRGSLLPFSYRDAPGWKTVVDSVPRKDRY